MAGIPTLKERREALFKAFTVKAYNSEIYRNRWFEDKTASKYCLRKERKVVQNFARCDRLQQAPIYRMRQLINELNEAGEL